MDKNLISVHIVAYNAEHTLSKTLESIKNQQGVSFEIIFINDASTDSTLSIAEKFKENNPQIPCTLISNGKNLGITKSRNIALHHSNGAHIAVCDSDDVWVNQFKLKKQIEFLKNNPDYLAIGTQMNIVDLSGQILKQTNYETEDKDIRKKFLHSNQIGHSSVLFKKTDLTYDESLYIWEDYDFFLRLGQQGKLANLSDVCVNYLYNSRTYTIEKKNKLNETEFQIITRYRDNYLGFWKGYLKYVLKKALILLHLK